RRVELIVILRNVAEAELPAIVGGDRLTVAANRVCDRHGRAAHDGIGGIGDGAVHSAAADGLRVETCRKNEQSQKDPHAPHLAGDYAQGHVISHRRADMPVSELISAVNGLKDQLRSSRTLLAWRLLTMNSWLLPSVTSQLWLLSGLILRT